MALTSAESLILLQDLAHSRTQSHADCSQLERKHLLCSTGFRAPEGEILKQVSLSLFTRAPSPAPQPCRGRLPDWWQWEGVGEVGRGSNPLADDFESSVWEGSHGPLTSPMLPSWPGSAMHVLPLSGSRKHRT